VQRNQKVTHVKVKHRPRLPSDNGPAFVSQALKVYLQRYRLKHIRGAPYHPMTQGKIERYHRSMKNVVKLQTFYFPWELEQAIEGFVTYFNNARYPEFTAKRVREWLERLDVRPPAPATTVPNTTQYEWVGLT
jgi:transposase InsO family protein